MPCAVYSAEGRLIKCNDAYREMNREAFGSIPATLERSDVTYEALMRARAVNMLPRDCRNTSIAIVWGLSGRLQVAGGFAFSNTERPAVQF